MKVHPAAALFPMLTQAALKELRHDMEVNGMLEPVKTWKGMIIDGRNRMEAIKGTVVSPKFLEMEFKDDQAVVFYIISTNIQRRHLTTSQRAMIAAELANLEQGRPKEEKGQICPFNKTSIATAAKQMGVSERGIKQAKAVLKASSELHEKVKSGEISVNAAHKQIAPPKPKPNLDPAPAVIKPDPAPVIDDPDFSDSEDPPEPVAEENAMIISIEAKTLVTRVLRLQPHEREWMINQLQMSL